MLPVADAHTATRSVYELRCFAVLHRISLPGSMPNGLLRVRLSPFCHNAGLVLRLFAPNRCDYFCITLTPLLTIAMLRDLTLEKYNEEIDGGRSNMF